MPEEEPVCDCEEGEPPDADPGCCGADTCEENETCCNETTCVLTSTFQTDSSNCGGCGIVCDPGETCVDGACTGAEDTCPPGYVSCGATGGVFILDSDVEWTWVNNNGCPEGCVAFKAEQPTLEEEAAGLTPGDFSYDGICCELEYEASYEAQVWDPRPCSGSPTWWFLSTPCPEGYTSSPPPGLPTNPPPCDPDYENGHIVESIVGCCEGIVQRPCTSVGALNYNPAIQLDEPCSQEECEAHVSTWMAEPIGEPNEEGLYKVKWILLDGCPGACCSDQPTQPEFVKTSTLIDAPCKCDCN